MNVLSPKSTSKAGFFEPGLRKKPTGIRGFDGITDGGLPEGRLTTIIGPPGSGKTVFGLQTLVNRLKASGEPCIFVTFEEPIDRIRSNVASFNWGFSAFTERQFRFVDAALPADFNFTGAFDLSGLLTILSSIQKEIGARNIVFDGIDMLLSSLPDEQLERRELARLDKWIRGTDLSAIITAKSFTLGDRDQRRTDFLQYMTDCVVIFKEICSETAATKTLRIAKYRGSGFAANPFPVIVGSSGIDLVLFKEARLNYPSFSGRLATGIPRLDGLLEGGYLQGGSVLISGTPGTSKTSLASSFVNAVCAQGNKALYVSFDESGAHIMENMKSIGIDLQPHYDQNLLVFESLLSGGHSPEQYFVRIRSLLETHMPDCLVIDPISAFNKANYPFSGVICEAILDFAKSRGITVLCTSLLGHATGTTELSVSQVSTIADTWIHVSNIAQDGERNRALTVIKSRGTNHSNQVRELILSQSGIDLVDVYVDAGVVLMGSARVQMQSEAQRLQAIKEIETKRRHLELDCALAEFAANAQIANMKLEWKKQETKILDLAETESLEMGRIAKANRARMRRADDDLKAFPAPSVLNNSQL